ncbi:MAG: hypothetical protein HZB53_05955 [Chloroflexi bacterium]|nr:hypothetical protein [Chloroflexota bacterium]
MSIAIRTPPAARADLGGCPMFPPNNVWNARVDNLPVHSQSAAYIASLGSATGLHPDFGSGYWAGYPIGMQYATVYSPTPSIPINYVEYGSQSDPGPFPIPLSTPVEGGSWLTNTGDRHVLVVNTFDCKLYELYHAYVNGNGGWDAGSGAVFDLTHNAPLRPDTWTSADAAGLSILPSLARYDEVASGVITHALRFTANCSSGNVWPARHQAPYRTGACNPLPPMGLRVRLKASYVINPAWSAQTKVILTALKTYGLILADNGSSWYISGAHNAGWVDDVLAPELSNVKGADFEVVDSARLMLDYNSWAAAVNLQYLPAIIR